MARIPNGNFSITLFQRWHKNYGEVYKCYKLKSFSQDSIIISFHFISSVQFISEIQPLEGWGCGGGGGRCIHWRIKCLATALENDAAGAIIIYFIILGF